MVGWVQSCHIQAVRLHGARGGIVHQLYATSNDAKERELSHFLNGAASIQL